MREAPENHRAKLLDWLPPFVRSVRTIKGVRQISLIGSIATTKANPKDIDLLVVVADDADLPGLARHARRLQGHAQQFNRGADVFLANERGEYIGRTCPWKDCRLGRRQSCDARHCGRRPHLHDDFDAVVLDKAVIDSPPVTLWPAVVIRGPLPADVEAVLKTGFRGERLEDGDAQHRRRDFMPSTNTDSPESAFHAYMQAFETLDPNAALPFYHVPGIIVAAQGVFPVSDTDGARALLSQFMTQLRSQSYRRSDVVGLTVRQLAPALASCAGTFVRFNTAGEEIARLGFTYTLRHSDSWKIVTAIIHEPLAT